MIDFLLYVSVHMYYTDDEKDVEAVVKRGSNDQSA